VTLSLRSRLFFVHALVVLVTLALFLVVAAREQRRWLIERNVDTLEHLAQLLVRELDTVPSSPEGDGETLDRHWSVVAASLHPTYDARITLLDEKGTVLGDSDVPYERLAEVENHAGRPEIRAALAGETGHSYRRSRTIGVELLYVAVPAELGAVAVVRLAEPLTIVTSLNRSLLMLSITAAAVTLVLSLFIIYWVVGRHAMRVRALEAVASAAGEGRAARAREQPPDELGRLGRALNQMIGELGHRMRTLENERDERERILAHMTDGVVLLDRDGHVLRANGSLASILGAAVPPAPGTPFGEFVRAPELDDLLSDSQGQRETLETELRLWAPRQKLIRATATPVGEGEAASTLIVLQDMTEAERVNRMRQDFVANVSHELRTPITSLRGYAETLLEGGLEDAEHRAGFVQVIRDQAARLATLVDDLLTLADLERRGAKVERKPIDLRELVERQVAAFRPTAARAGLALRAEPGKPLPLRGDGARIEQVIANLLDNAVKYTDEGTITVTAGETGDRVWCEVADTGPGIPDEDKPRLFERFYRVDKARSREKGGTGLGLSIVKHIISLHGGEVSLESKLGSGSTFRFELPRS